MRFEELNLAPQILQALTACGYDKPTPIRPDDSRAARRPRRHRLGANRHRKTAAFVLPALH
jgi:superfamily II DNA/RNA helicase